MICDFRTIPAGLIECKRCGRRLRWKGTATMPNAVCRADAPRSPAAAPPPSARCLHLGDSLRKVDCKTCRGPVQLEVFACAKYGECTRERRGPDVAGCCKGCALFEPAPEPPAAPTNFCGEALRAKLAERKRSVIESQAYGRPQRPAIERRNLIYYLLPLYHPDGVWQWHVEQLRKHLHLFNGRRVVWIAAKPDGDNSLAIEPAAKVRAAFGDDAASIEFIEQPNDPTLWERAAFLELLSRVASPAANEATFYFHAKGVRRAKQDAIRPWCEEIYRHNLGRCDDAMEALRYWSCAGIARGITDADRGRKGSHIGWQFAGTGWWFRHDAIFTLPDWREVIVHSHAVEWYLGSKLPISEAYCLAHDDVGGNAYDPGFWPRAREAFDRTEAGESIDPADVRVSIIVAARNYGRFLRDCLDSCLWQTHKPHEILYVDDCSTDGSAELAAGVEGVRVLELPRVAGVSSYGAVTGRNAGAANAAGDALLFVDGDDVLPADFVAKLGERLSPATPFAYPNLQLFGRENTFWRTPDWGKADLRQGNFCPSTSLIWREAFDAAGGWIDGDFGHMPDWHLYLRLSQLGEPRHADVALGYRKHGQNWTDQASAADQARIRRQILDSVDAWQKSRSGIPASF